MCSYYVTDIKEIPVSASPGTTFHCDADRSIVVDLLAIKSLFDAS